MLFFKKLSYVWIWFNVLAISILIAPLSSAAQEICDQFDAGIQAQLSSNQPIEPVCEIALQNGCAPVQCVIEKPDICGEDGAGCSGEAAARLVVLNADTIRLEAELAEQSGVVDDLQAAVESAVARNQDLEARLTELESQDDGEAGAGVQELQDQIAALQQQAAQAEQDAVLASGQLVIAQQAADVARQEAEAARRALQGAQAERESFVEAEVASRQSLSDLRGLRDDVALVFYTVIGDEVSRLSEGNCAPLSVTQNLVGEMPVFTVSGEANAEVAEAVSKISVPQWAEIVVDISATVGEVCSVSVGNFTHLVVGDDSVGVRLDDLSDLNIATSDLASASDDVCKEVVNLIETDTAFEAYRAATRPSERGAWLAGEVLGTLRVVSCVPEPISDAGFSVSQRPDVFASYLVFFSKDD